MKVKYLDGFVELVNDYRDTISYSVFAILGIVMFIFSPNKSLGYTIPLGFIQWRELARWVAWIRESRHPSPNSKVYALVLGLFCLTYSGCNCLETAAHLSFSANWWTKDHLWWNIVVGMVNLTMAYFFYWRTFREALMDARWHQIFRFILKLYCRDLWDYPRKQKPPKERLKQDKAAIKKLLQKMAE